MADPIPSSTAKAKPAKKLSGSDKMDVYFDAVSKTFEKKLQDALLNITAGNIRRLAIRNYVHFADRVGTRWAMTNAEEKAFKQTTTYHDLEAERKKIVAKFAEQNKGYSLSASADARSLNKQTGYWNNNASVKGLGKDLRSKALHHLGQKKYPDNPTDDDVTAFKKWLDNVGLRTTIPVEEEDDSGNTKTVKKTYKSATHATPGLSSHGRIRALDFTVWKGKSKIAGTITKTAKSVWDKPGWTTNLKDAITAVSSNWEGPLKEPYEPWHWTYTGE